VFIWQEPEPDETPYYECTMEIVIQHTYQRFGN